MNILAIKAIILSVITSKFFLLYLATMLIDNTLGYLLAWSKGNFKSSRMREGIVKHYTNTIITFVSMLFMSVFNLQGYNYFIALWFALYNATSIIEHCNSLGIPLPTFIIKGIKSQIENMDKGDEE